MYCQDYYIKFKVNNDNTWILINDQRKKFKNYKQFALSDIISNEKERIEKMWEDSVVRTVKYVEEHKDVPYNISVSGGKDSELLYHLWYEVIKNLSFTPNYEFIFFNTTNECAEVYKYIKQRPDIKIVNPDISWWEWVKTIQSNNLPTVFKRTCCKKYKEGQATKVFDKKTARVQVLGVRSNESANRSNYQFVMDYEWDKTQRGSSDQPKLWVKICPIVDYTTVDVWLTMILKGYYINPKYKYGWQRVGCTICPYSSKYDDALIKQYYPKTWNRFCKLATYSYEKQTVLKVQDISLQEYIDGIWKSPKSREEYILWNKPTPKNIHILAEYKGISDEMAAKYWNCTCGVCGKKVTPLANSMFFKYFGRFEGQTDERKRMCQSCLCKELNLTPKEYFQKALDFKNEGCELF